MVRAGIDRSVEQAAASSAHLGRNGAAKPGERISSSRTTSRSAVSPSGPKPFATEFPDQRARRNEADAGRNRSSVEQNVGEQAE
jgi:hypothetical protein